MIVPDKLYLESTNRCNCNCVFCYHDRQNHPVGDMPLDLVERLIPESRAKEVWFEFFGEPTLCSNLPDMVQAGVDSGVKTGFVTNGAQLTPELTSELMQIGVDRIIISLGGMDEETYSRVFRGPCFDTVMENALRATALARKHPTRVTIRLKVTEETLPQKKQMIDYWRTSTKDIHVTPEWATPYTGSRKPLRGFTLNCRWKGKLTREVSVKWDGDVPMCCMNLDAETVVGNVYDGNLLDIYNGEAMTHVREAVLHGRGGVPDRCLSCDLLPRGLWRLF